jgi:hypothetical protein
MVSILADRLEANQSKQWHRTGPHFYSAALVLGIFYKSRADTACDRPYLDEKQYLRPEALRIIEHDLYGTRVQFCERAITPDDRAASIEKDKIVHSTGLLLHIHRSLSYYTL